MKVNIYQCHATKKAQGNATSEIPSKSIREDMIGHFPIHLSKRSRCRNPNCDGVPITYCLKCKVFLCNNPKKRCFLEFHGVTYDIRELPH